MPFQEKEFHYFTIQDRRTSSTSAVELSIQHIPSQPHLLRLVCHSSGIKPGVFPSDFAIYDITSAPTSAPVFHPTICHGLSPARPSVLLRVCKPLLHPVRNPAINPLRRLPQDGTHVRRPYSRATRPINPAFHQVCSSMSTQWTTKHTPQPFPECSAMCVNE